MIINNTGFLNFAEQLEAVSKKLFGHYELETSTMANRRQILGAYRTIKKIKWGGI